MPVPRIKPLRQSKDDEGVDEEALKADFLRQVTSGGNRRSSAPQLEVSLSEFSGVMVR
jgi:hypothetical protein